MKSSLFIGLITILISHFVIGYRSIPATSPLNFNASLKLHSGSSGSLAQVSLDPERGPVLSQSMLVPQWNALGQTLNRIVLATVSKDGDIYVGGWFTNAGGNPDADYIARWDGCKWNAVGTGLNSGVQTLEVSAGDIYAGGNFTNAGGNPGADHIARWDGSSWNALGTGLSDLVISIAINGEDVYAGGWFTNAGGNPDADKLAHWDGQAWNDIGTIADGDVLASAISDNDFLIGGTFKSVGGNTEAGYLARWDGNSWNAVGSGVNHLVEAIEVYGDDIYVGGEFTNAGGNPKADRIARWDGNAWNAIGSGVSSIVWAIAIRDSDIFAGGGFSNAGGDPNADCIARWDGNAWRALGTDVNGTVTSIAFNGNDVYAGGAFLDAGGVWNADYIARWGEPEVVVFIPGFEDTVCHTDPPISLSTVHSGITGNWSGQGVIGNIFYPGGLNGEITLKFTPDPGQCRFALPSTITVVSIIPSITGIPDSICEASLPTLLPTTQSNLTGSWSGAGVSNNILEASGLNGKIDLTFTPDSGQCGSPIVHEIIINPATTPFITDLPSSVSETSPPIQLPLIQSRLAGNWYGQGVANNMFDPAGLYGVITLTFNPDPGQCAIAITADIIVELTNTYVVYLPTIFSPNGDGVNDVVTIHGTSVVRLIKSMRFFSRWGEVVIERYNFSPNDPGYGWDGSHKGQLLNPGVYAWVAEVEFVDGNVELFSGGVTLIR